MIQGLLALPSPPAMVMVAHPNCMGRFLPAPGWHGMFKHLDLLVVGWPPTPPVVVVVVVVVGVVVVVVLGVVALALVII